ncbi:helix-turn-helix domain-containing protein [Paenibacillus sp. CECT 9249]|uniref:helix-turn-helix domain-containing protein n=1 Tax=Paenibacillus sp. CECT 9249 TaxID=2845385 RepID=UPI001E3699BB|nr:helix-turn-helix domain-containing protein [Paenibacillus sp. CECT 9249]
MFGGRYLIIGLTGCRRSILLRILRARRQAVLRLAHRQGGDVNSGDAAKAFGVNRRTALKWLQRMASHGDLEAIRPNLRAVGFRIVPHQKGRGKR